MSGLVEYRIPLPFNLEEFDRGLFYMIAKVSNEDSSISNVEVLANESFEDPTMGKGVYTHKKYHLESSLPDLFQRFFPANSLEIDERSWNTFPKTKTIFQIKALMASIVIDVRSIHEEGYTKAFNIHQLSDELLNQRVVKTIDIAEQSAAHWDINPRSFQSSKVKRGPLVADWVETTKPLMCAYKLVKINCNLPGTLLQSKAIGLLEQYVANAIIKLHKQFFCYMDEWIDLPKDKILDFDKKSCEALNKKYLEMKKSQKKEKKSLAQFMKAKLRAKL